MSALFDRVEDVADRLLHPSFTESLDGTLAQRMVVVDVETTGLDVRRDDLLAIGAVSIADGQLDLSSGHSALIESDSTPSAANVLVHRLTPRRLRHADSPTQALEDFLHYAGHAPMLAYHAPFDAAVLRRAVLKTEARVIRPVWLDVAEWVLLARPEIGPAIPSLDDALAAFNIPTADRHDALADATATAWLALKLIAISEDQGIDTVRELRRRLRRHRTLRRWRG